MATGGDGSGDYASIDPGALKGAADSLQKSVDGVNGNIPGLKGDFGYFGIPTAHLDTLTKAASNLASLIPELRRRQSMAQQLVAENPAGGKIAYFQGDLLGQFKTVAAATAQAHIDAQNVKHAADHHERIPDSVYDDLRKYANDADFSAAFVNDLGTKYVGALLLDAEDTDDPGDKPDPNKMSAIGNLFATASHRVTFDRTYLDNLNKSLGDDWGLSTNARSAFDVFTPVLQYGVWDKQDLEDIADTALGYPKPDRNIWPADGTAMKWIFTGLANNPMASGDYFSKHRQDLYDYGKRSSYVADHGDASDAFGRFIQAATVDSRDDFARWALNGGPKGNLAEDNAAWIIHHVAGDKDANWSHAVLLAYSTIGTEYFDDLVYTMSSPIDAGSVNNPFRNGIEVGKDDWTAFLHTTMSDDEAFGRLTAKFQAWLKQSYPNESGSTHRDPHSPGEIADANAWTDFTQGRMSALYINLYKTIADDKHRTAEEQKEAIENVMGKVVDWATDPKGIAEDIEGMGKDAAKELVTGLLSSTVERWLGVGKDKLPPMPEDFSPSSAWTNYAKSEYQAGNIKPYNDGDVTWNGDPKFYEDLYGGKFRNDDGSFKSPDEIKKDPKAWQAYNEWLLDPAVQHDVSPKFTHNATGRGLDDAGG